MELVQELEWCRPGELDSPRVNMCPERFAKGEMEFAGLGRVYLN